MIRRSPAEFYIKFLLVHPDGYDNEQVREVLTFQHLDYIGEPYLERLRESLFPPRPFYPTDESHIRSQRFLIREKIRGLFLPDDHVLMAQQLLDTPRAKEVIESSFIVGSAPAWIRALLRRKGIECSTESLEIYNHFFWNVELIDSMEMKALIQLRVASHQTSDPYEMASNSALWKSHYSDPRWLAAKMPVTPLAGMMHELRMGVMPANVEVAKIASAARIAATVSTLDALTRGDKPEIAQGFALTAKLMTEVIESVGAPESELYGQLHKLMLTTDDQPVPHIRQLSDGNHTVDVQPIAEHDHERIEG